MKNNFACIFLKSGVVVKVDGQRTILPLMAEVPDALAAEAQNYLVGETETAAFYAINRTTTDHSSAPDGMEIRSLRPLFNTMPAEQFRMTCKAQQIVYWDNNSRFCPACGTAMLFDQPNVKRCPQCGNMIYPPVVCAVIVLVRKGDEILMVCAKGRSHFYGLVSGFLEPGETLEECVEREVMEETGLRIVNIQYVCSQPWPFPSGLMAAFTADYAGGEIKIQEDELVDAGFYGVDNLPVLPGELSVARRLIEMWRGERRKQG